MSKDDYRQEKINYSNSKHQNTFVENGFMVHLTKPNFSAQNVVDDHQVQHDDEENFTDLRSCLIPIDTDSDSSRSSSPFVIETKQSKSIFSPSAQTQNHMESNEDDDISENGIVQQLTVTSCSLEPYHLKSFDDILYLIQKDPYKFIFTPIPKQNTNYIQCRLVREKSGLLQMFYLEVELENNGKPVCLLTAEKETKIIGQSQYLISLNPNFNKDLCSAELICDKATGTSYTLYIVNDDRRQELAVILYKTNFLGLKGPRELEILLPKFNHQMQTLLEKNDISEYCSKEQNDSFIHLHNKRPFWNQESRSYVLRFDGKNRITLPSIKNFQMVLENKEQMEQIVMQFGRTTDNAFSCDFRYPLSFVQAFGIGLSTFETGVFRE